MSILLYASRASVAAGVMLLGMGAASAQAQGFGSAAFQSVRNCWGLADNINCMGPDNPDLTRKETYIPGGPGLSVNNVVYPQSGGTIVSRVAFGELDLPVVKSGVWAGDDNRIGSTIVTYMGFNFGGPDGSLYALDALIDWTSSGAPQNLANDGGEYGGEALGTFLMFLFDAAYVPDFQNAGQIIDFPTFKDCSTAGVLAYTEISMITATAGYHEASGTLGTGCNGNPLTLNSGGEYVLMTLKQTVANRLGYMDATNTIRVQLAAALPDEARQVLLDNVVTARSMVPEPATWAMLIIGFGAVGMAARRQRSHAAA